MPPFNTRPSAGVTDIPASRATTPAAILARLCSPGQTPQQRAALEESLVQATASLPEGERIEIEWLAEKLRTLAAQRQLDQLLLCAYLPNVPVPDRPFKPLFGIAPEHVASHISRTLRDARFTSLVEVLTYTQPELSKRIGENNAALVVEVLIAIGLRELNK